MEWQLQDAKNRFSEVVKDACSKGPQVITLRGQRTAVVMSIEAFAELQSKRLSFKDHLLSAGPNWDDEFIEMVTARDDAPDREIDLDVSRRHERPSELRAHPEKLEWPGPT